MRYLTHIVLHNAGVNPSRPIRDSFGLDASGCICELLTSPAKPMSHVLSGRHLVKTTSNSLDSKRKEKALTLHPDFSFEYILHTARDITDDIELEDFTLQRGTSHSTTSDSDASLPLLPRAQSQPWPTPPPPAHFPSPNNLKHKRNRNPTPLNPLPQIPQSTTNNPPPTTPSQ